VNSENKEWLFQTLRGIFFFTYRPEAVKACSCLALHCTLCQGLLLLQRGTPHYPSPSLTTPDNLTTVQHTMCYSVPRLPPLPLYRFSVHLPPLSEHVLYFYRFLPKSTPILTDPCRATPDPFRHTPINWLKVVCLLSSQLPPAENGPRSTETINATSVPIPRNHLRHRLGPQLQTKRFATDGGRNRVKCRRRCGVPPRPIVQVCLR